MISTNGGPLISRQMSPVAFRRSNLAILTDYSSNQIYKLRSQSGITIAESRQLQLPHERNGTVARSENDWPEKMITSRNEYVCTVSRGSFHTCSRFYVCQ